MNEKKKKNLELNKLLFFAPALKTLPSFFHNHPPPLSIPFPPLPLPSTPFHSLHPPQTPLHTPLQPCPCQSPPTNSKRFIPLVPPMSSLPTITSKSTSSPQKSCATSYWVCPMA